MGNEQKDMQRVSLVQSSPKLGEIKPAPAGYV